MAFLRSVEWRDCLFVLVTGLLLAVYVNYTHMEKQVAQTTAKIVTQKVTIASQSDAIETNQIVKKIDEATQVAVQTEVKAAVKQHEAIQQRVAEKEDVIRRRGQMETNAPIDYAQNATDSDRGYDASQSVVSD
jgi:triphosphoribosyl-dephospho-CoA synthetase